MAYVCLYTVIQAHMKFGVWITESKHENPFGAYLLNH